MEMFTEALSRTEIAGVVICRSAIPVHRRFGRGPVPVSYVCVCGNVEIGLIVDAHYWPLNTIHCICLRPTITSQNLPTFLS